MRTFSNEAINEWADVFAACRLHQTGMSLETFLVDPEQHLATLGMADALDIMATGYLPLLPAQAKVRQEFSGSPVRVQSIQAHGTLWQVSEEGLPRWWQAVSVPVVN